jgi:hypothetical protein
LKFAAERNRDIAFSKKKPGHFDPVSSAPLERVYVATARLVSETDAVAICGPLIHLAPANSKGARIQTFKPEQFRGHYEIEGKTLNVAINQLQRRHL